MAPLQFDYVAVGSGPSGCVTAARLVSDFGANVLLVEAGPRNNHPRLKMPAGFIKMLTGSKYLCFNETVPQPQLDGCVHEVLQGHVHGGGSTVNAMVYMRGRPSDYAHWDSAAGGAANSIGWGWDDLLPHLLFGNQCAGDGSRGSSV